MLAFDVRQHPLTFGMVFDRLAGDAGQIINLFDCPALRSGAGAGALQMVLGAIALGLFVAADTNPDANFFGRRWQGMVFLHTLLHGKE